MSWIKAWEDVLDPKDCKRICEEAERCVSRFMTYPRRRPDQGSEASNADFDPLRDSEYEDHDSYQVMQREAMPPTLRTLICDSLLRSTMTTSALYFQLNRYRRGDYVLPHRDTCPQGILSLTASERDGLNIEAEPGHVQRMSDRPGRLVIHAPQAWHWVDPVSSPVRYTLVTIPHIVPRWATTSEACGQNP